MGWAEILQFSSFAVLFFLATFFCPIANKLYVSDRYPWRTRLTPLLIPYSYLFIKKAVAKLMFGSEVKVIKE